MTNPEQQHLTTEEIELWAQGLLGAARAIHLADCTLCREEAGRERKIILELVQLPQFAPTAGFADRVMSRVKIPTPSGDWEGR
ncbi:MAG TPA: hypothetical protein VGQ06_09200 [Gemmatimonadales bacterium]|jgi:hypothetical protein|nr:hypothetical protein [Gemmatimonadales bacterium]